VSTPRCIAAIAEANVGHTPGYGGDPWTARFHDIMAHHFGPEARAFPVFNGTGANVLALQSALPRWAAVITAASAHINYDETGAPEKVGGLKIIGAATENGKLTPETIKGAIIGRGSEHNAQPLAVSISQSAEWGTTYTPDEIAAIAATAHENDMILHVDGSRLGNAAAHLGVGLGDITTAVGVDIVSLGGTKNGLLGAEAVVVLNPDIGHGMRFLRKMNLQLASKMRFLSAQLNACTKATCGGTPPPGRTRWRSTFPTDSPRWSTAAESSDSRSCRRSNRMSSSSVCPPRWPSVRDRSSLSLTGPWRRTSSVSCAPSTRRPRTSTRSSPPSPATTDPTLPGCCGAVERPCQPRRLIPA
jgi:hypothetical protein